MSWDRIGEVGLDQVLARRLLTPGGVVAPTVAPELFPGLTLENDRPEWGYLKGELRFSAQTASVAAVAGQRSRVRIVNPASSGIIAVITFWQGVAAQLHGMVRAALEPPILGTQPATPCMDTRILLVGANQASRCIVSYGAEVGGLPGGAPINVFPGNTQAVLGWPLILAPGSGFEYTCFIDNTALSNVVLSWTERKASPSELV